MYKTDYQWRVPLAEAHLDNLPQLNDPLRRISENLEGNGIQSFILTSEQSGIGSFMIELRRGDETFLKKVGVVLTDGAILLAADVNGQRQTYSMSSDTCIARLSGDLKNCIISEPAPVAAQKRPSEKPIRPFEIRVSKRGT